MNEFERFEKALEAAEKAGDSFAARKLATEMRRMMMAQNPELGRPMDVPAEASKMAAQGVGIPEAILTGTGRAFDQIGAGIQQAQLGSAVKPSPAWLPQVPGLQERAKARQTALGAEQAEKDVAYSGLQKARPFSTAIGEAVPAAVAASAPSLGLIGSSVMAGGTEASKYGTPEERAKRGMLAAGGNVVGGLLGSAAGKLIAPVKSGAVSGAQRSTLSTMDSMGVQPRMSQVTGSPFWSRVEDWASRTPGGAGVMRDFTAKNQAAVNRTAASGMGSTADELTPAVFSEASQRLGKVFEDIKALPGKTIQVSAKVGSVADDILRQQRKMLPTQQDANLMNLANQAKALSGNKGKIDGETYQLTRSGLSEASYEATGTNKALYGKLLDALDDSADASLRAAGNTQLADALRTVRPQYANLKMLEKGAVAEGGNVSPARLASVMRTQNPAAFREGRMQGNPLYDIAQYGENFKPLTAGSPTFERGQTASLTASLLGAATSYPAAKIATSQAAQFYPRHIGGTQAAGLLSQGMNPAVRAGTMGILQTSAGPILLPIMAE